MEKPTEGGVLIAVWIECLEPLRFQFTDCVEGIPGQHHMHVAAAAMDYMMMTGGVGRLVMIVGISVCMTGIAG